MVSGGSMSLNYVYSRIIILNDALTLYVCKGVSGAVMFTHEVNEHLSLSRR